eukprot:3773907-Amphidinium_carterae.1
MSIVGKEADANSASPEGFPIISGLLASCNVGWFTATTMHSQDMSGNALVGLRQTLDVACYLVWMLVGWFLQTSLSH